METTFDNRIKQVFPSSYRTYEEWKHRYSDALGTHELRSYRTYEEWKREEEIYAFTGFAKVLTVPMRNGNQQQ